MTTRLSIDHKLPGNRWRITRHANMDFPGWSRDVAFLRRMWELGQDTVLVTAFYEPFVKPVRQFWFFDWHLE